MFQLIYNNKFNSRYTLYFYGYNEQNYFLKWITFQILRFDLLERSCFLRLLLRVVNCNVWCLLQCKGNSNRPGSPGAAGTTWKTPLEYQESAGQSPCWQPLFKMMLWSCQSILSLPYPFFLQTLEMGIYGSNEKSCKPPEAWLAHLDVCVVSS